MNNTLAVQLKPVLCLSLLGALPFLLCSCASTSVKGTWKAPEFEGPVGKVAALALEDRPLLREGFENRFVGQLRNSGTPALTTFKLLSLHQIKEDKRAAAECFRTNGADVVLILRMLDAGANYREFQSSSDRYAGVISAYDNTDWYGYYSVAFMNLSPTYGSLNRQVYLETTLFSLKTEKRLWSGVTRTVLKEGSDAVAEMDPLVAKILAAMRKDNLIR